YEVIQVSYDSQKLKLKDLLSVFWRNVDPFDDKGQFCDKGEQYLSAIFYADAAEKKEIDESINALKKQGIKTEKIVTKILPLKTFFNAEEYHQSYYEKNPIRYKYYRSRCGRDSRLKEVWGSNAG
ncbi:MAG: peptide-methionine (S)-S-oxide reductase MsrA, partial [Pseudobdellovibrio sp.]